MLLSFSHFLSLQLVLSVSISNSVFLLIIQFGVIEAIHAPPWSASVLISSTTLTFHSSPSYSVITINENHTCIYYYVITWLFVTSCKPKNGESIDFVHQTYWKLYFLVLFINYWSFPNLRLIVICYTSIWILIQMETSNSTSKSNNEIGTRVSLSVYKVY